MAEEYSCPVCGWKYDPKGKSKCPSCYSTPEEASKVAEQKAAEQESVETSQAASVKATGSKTQASEPKPSSNTIQTYPDELLAAIERQIDATNRTTYAVRSMVSYTVITILGSIVGALLIGIGFGTQTLALIVLGVLVFLGGNIAALVALVREWSLSRVTRK